MLKTTVSLSKPLTPSVSVDALSQVLNSMRISGSLLLKERYKTPWAVSVPDSNTLNKLLETSDDVRIAAFHMVERGHINIRLKNGESTLVEAGEMVVCFSGIEHTLYEGNEQRVIPFQEIMSGGNHAFEPDDSEQLPCTSLVCGVFLLQDMVLNPLLATLPPFLKFSVSNPNRYPRLYGVVNLLVQEFQYQAVGNSYVVQRYLEILCVEAIRSHVDALPEQSSGWLSALKDPVIGRAIEIIHSKPGYNWSVKSLANEVSISPSRFAARFSTTLGESPMIYVTKWRMFVASRMLEENQRSIDQIANEVGYESLAAFSRAFKRHVGLPPAAWRSRLAV
ncbi:MAG: AraC family transcriptional regulator [Thiotrichaceae bacterium]